MKSKLAVVLAMCVSNVMAQDFKLNEAGYFVNEGVNVMSFDDFYPEGHQGGVSIIMNGKRIATNGDIRMEATPGQWQPVPRKLKRETGENWILTSLCYPDSSRHLAGGNPMIYPDYNLKYQVRTEADGDDIIVTVDLDTPVPDYLLGKAGFNLEFFPGELFGKPWIMDDQTGIFPQQPNSPMVKADSYLDQHIGNYTLSRNTLPATVDRLVDNSEYCPIKTDNLIAEPYATGMKFTSCPDDNMERITIESLCGSSLKLYDGRMNHNNGWFVLRSEIPAGATKGAIKWRISPSIAKGWMYKPVVQTSQVGYMTNQTKQAVIELDKRDEGNSTAKLYRITAEGEKLVKEIAPVEWGNFLRYRYVKADFSDVKEQGMYRIRYAESESPAFRISDDVFDRGVWQPVVEYFLPVQMCHMRVNEKYKVWHQCCHMDDGRLAPTGNHIDGYVQQPGIETPYKTGDVVSGVNIGGWHDAGDFDLRVESQAGECYILSLAYEAFKPEIDATSIDQHKHVTEIHQPDGKNDILQQIENGALSVVAGYKSLKRLYRGIICGKLRQYVMLGDASAMTDNIPGNDDDRWVFTEDNPPRELSTAADLAATSRALREFNDTLSQQCLDIAKAIYNGTQVNNMYASAMKLKAAAELYLATDEKQYLDYIVSMKDIIKAHPDMCGWFLARVEQKVRDMKDKKVQAWIKVYRNGLDKYAEELRKDVTENPYGVPYRPSIWGAGWDIQRFGFENYYLASAYPDKFSTTPVTDALNFILGCHPGSNQASFAGGVGQKSATVGYGLNRSDWSYIPGGVVSGTALIRPDFPELLTFPYLWQQVEYVLGGGSSHYMFLVLAAKNLLNR